MSGTNGAANLQNAFFATPKQHATEGPPKTCCPGAWRPFWILVKTKRVQLLGLLGLLLLLVLLLEVVLQASKTHPSPHRNTMLLKDGTTSKNMLPRGLTSLLDSGKKRDCSCWAAAAAGAGDCSCWACCCCCPCCSCCCWCCWSWCCKPPKRTLRHTETPCYWRTERPPKTCCSGAWRPFWILVKTKRLQLLLLLLLLLLHAAGGAAGGDAASLQNAPFATPKHHATEGRNDLQKHAAPGAWRPFWF